MHSIAARMPPEDDWFFGAEMRLEGQVCYMGVCGLLGMFFSGIAFTRVGQNVTINMYPIF